MNCTGQKLFSGTGLPGEQYWHFSEGCEFEQYKYGFIVRNNGYDMRLELDSTLTEIQMVRAQPSGQLGWISRRFGVKKPCTTIACSKEITGDAVLETSVTCLRPDGDIL